LSEHHFHIPFLSSQVGEGERSPLSQTLPAAPAFSLLNCLTLPKGDVVLLSMMERSAQRVTAKKYAESVGAEVLWVPVTKPEGRIDLIELEKIVSQKKKKRIFLSISHVSQVTGIINPISQIRKILGESNFICLDLSQSAGHMPIDLNAFKVDFAGVTAHKMFGPMGKGALFINKKRKNCLSGHISGGSAVALVSKHAAAPSGLPAKFEPGTQNIEGAIEWSLTLDYLNRLGMDSIEAHERTLGEYFLREIQKISKVKLLGPTELSDKTAIINFIVGPVQPPVFLTSFAGITSEAIEKDFDRHGIRARNGCFLTHKYVGQLLDIPVLKDGDMDNDIFLLPGALRVSFSFYNTLEEVYAALKVIKKM